MRIDQLPDLPGSAGTVKVPVTFNGADYKADFAANNAVYTYQSGDQINDLLYGFGYVTSDAKQLTFICQLPKMFSAGATVEATSILASIRVVQGGYLDSAISSDITDRVTSIVGSGNQLVFNAFMSTPWPYGTNGSFDGSVRNNTPVVGYLEVQLEVN